MKDKLNNEQINFVKSNFRNMSDEELGVHLELKSKDIAELLKQLTLERTAKEIKKLQKKIQQKNKKELVDEHSFSMALPKDKINRKIAIGFISVLALMPFLVSTKSFGTYDSLRTFIWELAVSVGFIIVTLLVVLYRNRTIIFGKGFWPLLLLFVWSAVRAWESRYTSEAWHGVHVYFIFFATYFLAVNLFRKKEEIMSAIAAIGFGAFLVSLFLVGTGSLILYSWDSGDAFLNFGKTHNLIPFFGQPEYASAFLLGAIPLAVCIAVITKDIAARSFWCIAVFFEVILFLQIKNPHSFFSIACAVVCAIVIFIIRFLCQKYTVNNGKATNKILFVIFSIIILCVVFFVYKSDISKSINSSSQITDPGVRIRLCTWESSFNMLEDYGWFKGCGPWQYMSSIEKYRLPEERVLHSMDKMLEKSPNDFIHILSVLGIPGLFLICWYIFAMLWSGFRVLLHTENMKVFWLGLGIVTSLFAFLFDSIFYNPILFFSSSLFIFWTISGLLSNLSYSDEQKLIEHVSGDFDLPKVLLKRSIKYSETNPEDKLWRLIFIAFTVTALIGLFMYSFGKITYDYHFTKAKAYFEGVDDISNLSFQQKQLDEARLINLRAQKIRPESYLAKKYYLMILQRVNQVGDLEITQPLNQLRRPEFVQDFIKAARESGTLFKDTPWGHQLLGMAYLMESELKAVQQNPDKVHELIGKSREEFYKSLELDPYNLHAYAGDMSLYMHKMYKQYKDATGIAERACGRLGAIAHVVRYFTEEKKQEFLRKQVDIIFKPLRLKMPINFGETPNFRALRIGSLLRDNMIQLRRFGTPGTPNYHYRAVGFLKEDKTMWYKMLRYLYYGGMFQDVREFGYVALKRFDPKLTSKGFSLDVVNEINRAEIQLQGIKKDFLKGTVFPFSFMQIRERPNELYNFIQNTLKINFDKGKILFQEDFADMPGFCIKVQKDGDKRSAKESPAKRLYALMTPEAREVMQKVYVDPNYRITSLDKYYIVSSLERSFENPDFFIPKFFLDYKMPDEIAEAQKYVREMSIKQLKKHNKQIFDMVYKEYFKK